MAEPGRRRGGSVRLRTAAAATAVVALALLVGAVLLVSLVRGSLRDGVETTAEQRASALADQLEAGGTSALPTGDADDPDDPDDSGDPDDDADDADDLDDDPDELVWQVRDGDDVLASSHALRTTLPHRHGAEVTLGGDQAYLVVSEDADVGDRELDVVVAVSLEDVDDSVAALVPPLAVGLPVLLLLVAGTTWVVAGRALAPVERIRREVEQITGDRLDRRVPEPGSRDEVQRLALTMNQMLGRLEDSGQRQRQFVADASHELRSPLAVLRQTAEVARTHPGALPEGELADAVLEEGARMQRLVEQLLVLTRADEPATRAAHDVDLDDLALTEARRAVRPGVRVDTSGISAGRVRGDQLALGQVVRNLVDNAVRHARSQVALTVREHGGAVELLVDDDGAGVPEDQRERVFERFVRLDEARSRDAGGSGLGLAIVRSHVAAHGGAVTCGTSPLGGARFAVRLPGDAPAS